ncbi:MAG: DUF4294 domain-containing protein [Bacteroidetes bacterium]|jgi:hypothetical protein|nr:DUF4294 domain-containing protein [Bacteroidota bacterium]
MKRMLYLIILTFLIATQSNYAQTRKMVLDTMPFMQREIINTDTFFVYDLDEIKIYPEPTFDNRFEYWRYRRLVRNVKKVYPYAKMAGEKLEEVNDSIKNIESERLQKAYIKDIEEEIKEEYEDELKGLTITQGKILIKLIDRETGDTSYELVKDLRGTFSAIFWQTLARLFGSNLKAEFDPGGEDELLNRIVLMIENGQL